jgi:tetraacyldisaccharide 4'-kinase
LKELLSDFELWASDVIFGRARGFRAFFTRVALRCLSGIYRMGVQLRKFSYHSHYKIQNHMGILTISVGNITVGGTGKTPVVEFLSRALRDKDRHVTILSRGYKSKALSGPQNWTSTNKTDIDLNSVPKIVSTGKSILLDSEYAGDEPLMLARNLENVAVLVDKDRVKSAKFAISQFNSDTFILDDGMQYLPLARAIDIVLIDASQPFGTGAMLPAGTLREPKKNLKRAHFIIITKSDGSAHEDLIKKIRKYNKLAPIITSTHSAKYLQNLKTNERKELDYLSGKHVAALSGIAVPENFEKSLQKLGAILDIKKSFSDHHRFSRKEIDKFTHRCMERDIEFIVTTEKDAVRYTLNDDDIPVWFLRIEIEIIHGIEDWNKMIHVLCSPNVEHNSVLRNREHFCY